MKMTIAEAKEALITAPSLETNTHFSHALSEAVDKREWIAAPVVSDERGKKHILWRKNSSLYIVLFSSENHYRLEKDAELMMTDINRIIDCIYESTALEGFVLDPYTTPIFVSRSQLNICTRRKDPRLQKRDWGVGIPQYHSDDLMTAVEVQKFAMQIAENMGLTRNGFKVIEKTVDVQAPFSFAVRKDGELSFVLVRSSVAPKKPSFPQERKNLLIAYAKKHKAKAIYIPVGIGASDSERFNAGLTLIGDAYYANYHGMYEVHEDGSVSLMNEL